MVLQRNLGPLMQGCRHSTQNAFFRTVDLRNSGKAAERKNEQAGGKVRRRTEGGGEVHEETVGRWVGRRVGIGRLESGEVGSRWGGR